MLLALDTATPRVSVSLWGPDEVGGQATGGGGPAGYGPIASSRAMAGRRHAEILAPAVRAVVEGSGHRMADLTAVAVDVGPGLFTGLRVGVATAKALAAALDLRAVGVTSLEVLAYPHRRQPAVVAAVVDARRREVFRALYETRSGRLVELTPPGVVSPAELAEELAALDAAVLAVGDGARRYAEVLVGDGRRIEVAGSVDAHPDAEALAELAAARLTAGLYTDANGLRPCYLRPADVRIGWDQRDGSTPRVRVAPATGGPDRD
jgi:tRNA threonylcarbamoyladenosine biosynthesis protein TsaB